MTARSISSILAALFLAISLSGCSQRRTTPPPPPVAPELHDNVQKATQLPYDQLFEKAAELKFSANDLEAMNKHLSETQDYCKQRAKTSGEGYEKEGDKLMGELKRSAKQGDEPKRHELRCQIQDLRSSKAQMEVLAQQLVPTAFQNSRAKLELIEKWPAEEKQIKQQIESGAYLQRRWGNVTDIGFRTIEPNQKDDIKRGETALRELRQQGAMPPELENKQIQDYVNTVAQRIAVNSDLQIPLRVMVLDSKEVNAFALPGGFLFVQRGLLEEVEDESQLAGVIAHEISHVTARHSYRLYKQALASSIAFQMAQIAAIILTGGAAGVGTYYALQYGFYGLGFALELNLLGVSRDFELEADQLGIQYAWKSGYDPEGFIRFFDKMASKHGYAIGASWFRTHPPFYQRMVDSKREIMFLPAKESWIVQTLQFEQMKPVLKEVSAKSNAAQEGKRPTLMTKEEGCEKPKELYQPTEPIEAICFRLEEQKVAAKTFSGVK
jgi:Zn-dependent protease with chaperone function